MSNIIIEWAPFRLKPGIDERTLLNLSEGLQSGFLALQSGYIRRELIRGREKGEYVDVVWWASMKDAEAAMSRVAESPACHAYFAAMANETGDPGAGVSHFRRVQEY